jgi:hypothetical protein
MECYRVYLEMVHQAKGNRNWPMQGQPNKYSIVSVEEFHACPVICFLIHTNSACFLYSKESSFSILTQSMSWGGLGNWGFLNIQILVCEIYYYLWEMMTYFMRKIHILCQNEIQHSKRNYNHTTRSILSRTIFRRYKACLAARCQHSETFLWNTETEDSNSQQKQASYVITAPVTTDMVTEEIKASLYKTIFPFLRFLSSADTII